ncbi:Repeat domain-containing protein [Mariniphaga anaerophila]|uniref:Repeat domain-containing protein n=2 Tax=Mariniphaga anaerophila TaxID=1484053 RepID=A0A1M5A7L0_9BACT|nr:Repeat domain-containing protein [Mariniphaga anaerophila]
MKLFMARKIEILIIIVVLTSLKSIAQQNTLHELGEIVRLEYNNPGLLVDLGVGLWALPMPMDFNDDGNTDMVVSNGGRGAYNGLYFFKNSNENNESIFEPPVRIGDGPPHIQVSYPNNEPRILGPGIEYINFKDRVLKRAEGIFNAKEIYSFSKRRRSTQWKYVDYDNDGDLDILVGVDDWSDYGWDNAFNSKGEWTRGELHGYVVLIENINGEYKLSGQLQAGGRAIDVYGMSTPNMEDFDGDGDLDLICGEFTDRLTWFENIGTREKPEFAEGRFLENNEGIIHMDLQMISPVAFDWDKDGKTDLVVGEEDGRVALLRNTGEITYDMPQFESPVFLKQEAGYVKFGALVTPFSIDWDDDGDEDLICGNSAGYIGYIENLDGGNLPKWDAPVYLKADGEVIRIMADENGSIQGPAEKKWGYTSLSVADWDGDGLKDIVINSIWGKIEWYKNNGKKGAPKLTKMGSVKIDWEGQEPKKPTWNWWNPGEEELVTQWRTTPFMIDWNKDGLMDLIMLDDEGYLAFFERFLKNEELYLKPGKRIFMDADNGGLLRLNDREAGSSGRRKICLVDWDGDGKLDLLANSKNVEFYKNTGSKNGLVFFKQQGDISDISLAGHSTSPTVVDWNNNGKPDLLFGAEDGHLYFFKNE